MPATVHLAGPDDAAALAALRWRWRADERGEQGMGEAEFLAAFTQWVHDHATTHLAWLGEIDGEPAGMAWLAVVERIPGPGHWSRLSGNLQSVYVVPEHRNAGLGEKLVAAAIERGRALGMEYLTVHPSDRSFPLYRRAGFGEWAAALELRFPPLQA